MNSLEPFIRHELENQPGTGCGTEPGTSGGGSRVPGAEGSPGGWVGSGCLPSGGLHRLQLASGAEEGPGRSGRA